MARKKMTTCMGEDLVRSAMTLAAKRDGRIYEVFEEALRRNPEETSEAEVTRGETRDAAHEKRQPRARIPLRSGGKDQTLGERFEEELYRS